MENAFSLLAASVSAGWNSTGFSSVICKAFPLRPGRAGVRSSQRLLLESAKGNPVSGLFSAGGIDFPDCRTAVRLCLEPLVLLVATDRDPNPSQRSLGSLTAIPSPDVVLNQDMRVLFEIFGQTLTTLWAHKLRSFLTMFGIAWGVGSLLLLVGLGEGFRSGNKREMAEFGKDIMFLFPGRAPVVEGSMRSARNYLLTYQDYLDIRSAPYIRNASP